MSVVSTPVSKTGSEGSNPSGPAKTNRRDIFRESKSGLFLISFCEQETKSEFIFMVEIFAELFLPSFSVPRVIARTEREFVD